MPRRSLADVEAESRGQPYRMLLIGPGEPTQMCCHDRLPVECQRVLVKQQFHSNGLVENRTASAEGDQPKLNSPSASKQVRGNMNLYSAIKIEDSEAQSWRATRLSRSFDTSDRFEIGRYEQTFVMWCPGFFTICDKKPP